MSSLECKEPDLTPPLQELETKGFTILHGLFDDGEIEDIAKRFQVIKERALGIIENSSPVIRSFSENNMTNQTQYWKTEKEVILQAGKGRYDFYRGFSKDLLSSTCALPHPI